MNHIPRRAPAMGAAAVAAALAISLAACSTGEPAGESGGTLTVGLITSGSLDPFNQSDPNGPLSLVYDGLVQVRDVEGEPVSYVPLLATDWEFNEDFTAISLNLRDDVVFSDGTPFDAEVVKRNFEESLKNPTSYAPLMGDTTVDVTGDYSVTINYTADLALTTVLDYLAGATMISPEALEDPGALAATAVGTGPYLFDAESSTTDAQMVFVRNETGYSNPDTYQWDKIVVKLFADQVAVLNALKSGQIDFGPVDISTADEAEASGLELSVGLGRFSGLYFVDRDGTLLPPLGDVRVRQAINMAFDREAIVEAIEHGHGEPGNQALPFSDPELEDRYPYDPDAARDLMAEAGYADGFDLPMPSFGSPYEPIVQQALGDIGIRVVYETAQAADYFATANSGVWSVLLGVGAIGPFYSLTIEQFYVSAGGFYNVLAEPVAEVEDLLQTYRYGDDAERASATAELGEYLLDEAWFAVFTYPHTLYAHSPEVVVVANYNRGLPPSLLFMRPAE